jgi:hypothetical protein
MLNPTPNRRQFLIHTARVAAISAAVVPQAPMLYGRSSGKTGRISYYRDGQIFVAEVGKPDGKPLTSGHWDFKPSWSLTDDLLVCFRRIKDDPETEKWKTAIFTIHVDGTGFHQLTDGSHTDFNPTWTRDGKNTPIWNRRNNKTGGYYIMSGKLGEQPGQETTLTDDSFHTWAHSCLKDGRILVNALHPQKGWGVFLLSAKGDKKPTYERVECELSMKGQLHRASISPSEKRICFEYLPGAKFTEPGHILYIADFDAKTRIISNLKAIANEKGKPHWYAYPRWIDGESEVVYHRNDSGKGELFVYRLNDGSTTKVSTDSKADYRYPHGEAAPC